MLLLMVPSAVFLNVRGMEDVPMWRDWARKVNQSGDVGGYRIIAMEYPPFASGILGLSTWAGDKLDLSPIASIKFSLLIALMATTGVMWMLTKNFWASVLTYAALLVPSAALGFLDCYYMPLFFGALAAFSRKRYTIFAVLYTLTCFIKWQPIIVAPFFALHIMRCHGQGMGWRSGLWKAGLKVVLPALGICLAVRLRYGWQPLSHAFYLAFFAPFHRALSLNALNLPWCVTHFLEMGWPDRFGALQHGEAQILRYQSDLVQMLGRLPFVAAYLFCLHAVMKKPVSAGRTIRGALMGMLCYFTLATGVHENHIIVAVCLALYLFAIGDLNLEIPICLALIMNANLYVFDDLSGMGYKYDRQFWGLVDIGLCMAITNVIVVGIIIVDLLGQLRGDSEGPPDLAQAQLSHE